MCSALVSPPEGPPAADDGSTYALFGSGGGAALAAAIDAPLLGTVPIEPEVAAGGDAGEPVVIAGTGRAARAFDAIARRLVTEIAPPRSADAPDMAGCSARLFETVNAAFAELDANA